MTVQELAIRRRHGAPLALPGGDMNNSTPLPQSTQILRETPLQAFRDAVLGVLNIAVDGAALDFAVARLDGIGPIATRNDAGLDEEAILAQAAGLNGNDIVIHFLPNGE